MKGTAVKRVLAMCLIVAAIGAGVASPAAADSADGLKAKPRRVNFGTKAVGTFTVKGSTITNMGASDVLVQTSAVRMPDQFSWGLLPGQTCPIFSSEILPVGESCRVVAGFRPEEFFIGLVDMAVLQVTATDPSTGVVLNSVSVEFVGEARGG
jgi:hypothetical protein